MTFFPQVCHCLHGYFSSLLFSATVDPKQAEGHSLPMQEEVSTWLSHHFSFRNVLNTVGNKLLDSVAIYAI